MAFGHHQLVALQPGCDQHPPVRSLPGAHGAELDRVVRAHDPDEIAARPVPQRGLRYRRGAVPGVHDQPPVHEIARPQAAVLVGEAGLQLDGAGGLVHRVVHQIDRALIQLGRVVRAVGQHRHMHLPGMQPALRRQRWRGRVKITEIGCNWVMRHDGGAVRRVQEIALVHLAYADPAGDGRAQRGVAELGLRVIDLRIVVADLGAVLIDQGLLLVELLAAGEILHHQIGVAVQVQHRPIQQRLVLLPSGLLLFQLRAQRARVDERERRALLHILPLGEQDLRDGAIDLRLHIDGVVGLDRADAGQEDRHVLKRARQRQRREPARRRPMRARVRPAR